MYTPIAGQKLSHFLVLEQIGAGGMGVVFRAHDEYLDRDVAIKVLAAGLFSSDTTRRHFRKEALTLSRLNHPNIATVYEFGTQDGIDFMVMEYIPGETLNDRVASGSMPEKEIVGLGLQLADGLRVAHQEGILHRDLKPGNLRMTPEGRLKILDFGLARFVTASLESLTTESAAGFGNIPGTLPYMAPEQLREEETDERADIYSVGSVFYEMATGRRAFPHMHVARLVEAILHEDPDPPSSINRHLSPALEMVILKCLDKDRERRYQSATELHVDLQRLAAPSVGGTSVHARLHAHPRRTRGTRMAVLFALALALLLVLTWFTGKPFGLRFSGSLPAEKHVAVLPFVNVGGHPESQAFCDGLVETITSKLTQLEQYHRTLWVVPASEVRAENVDSVRQAQKAFGVTLVITGSVHREADHVQLTANLVDAKSLRQLQAVTILTDIEDPVLQDGLVHQVAGMLELQLDPKSQDLLAAARTPVGRAYDLYLRGQGYLQRPEKLENLEAAITIFERALVLDSKFALAYAGLARAYWLKYDLTGDSQWVQPAHLNAKKAIELNGELPAVRVTLGVIQIGTGDYEEAIWEFERVLQRDPVNFEALRGLAQAYEKLGQLQKAEASYRRAIDLQPANPFAYTSLGSFYYSIERYEDALKLFERVVQLVPDNSRAYSNLGAIYMVMGRYREMAAALEKSAAIRPTSDVYWNLGYAHFLMRRFSEATKFYEQAAQLKQPEHYFIWGGLGDAYYWSPGQRGKAAAAYERAIVLAQEKLRINPRDANARIGLSYFYGKLGNKEESFRYLRQAIDLNPDNAHFAFLAALVYSHLGESSVALDWLERAAAGGYSKAEIRDRIEFDNLHEHTRFEALVQEVPKSK